MIYHFKCESCAFVQEIIHPANTMTFEARKCPRCGRASKHQFEGAPAVATSGMDNSPADVVIGREAEAKWADIRKRQALRNKVRQESGQEAVRMTGRNEFEAIPGAERRFVKAPNSGEDKD